MFGLQPLHWLIIILVAILLFAPMRIPQLVRSLKQTFKEFGASVREATEEPPQDKTKGQ
ncbi:MAG: twin-arginine translocase TatA/TatE family subunit [Chloroflexi bacterium]|nr:twin-arginine translocase TatA/TatE family subunit [Chloroflexota bacterium]MCL5952438.1 twin-arginine translocase TatA/TatE family subunit [Chloroflexota bacterium]